jgi:hypothetical protein
LKQQQAQRESLKNVEQTWFVHCPKNLADFRNNKGGSPLEGKFPGNSRKHGIISSDCWEKISPPWDFLPYNLGNLPCFGVSVGLNVCRTDCNSTEDKEYLQCNIDAWTDPDPCFLQELLLYPYGKHDIETK